MTPKLRKYVFMGYCILIFKLNQVDSCQYLCWWLDAWIRNVQNQLLTLTSSLTTQEIIQEFSVTRKPISSTPTTTSSSSSKKKKKPVSTNAPVSGNTGGGNVPTT